MVSSISVPDSCTKLETDQDTYSKISNLISDPLLKCARFLHSSMLFRHSLISPFPLAVTKVQESLAKTDPLIGLERRLQLNVVPGGQDVAECGLICPKTTFPCLARKEHIISLKRNKMQVIWINYEETKRTSKSEVSVPQTGRQRLARPGPHPHHTPHLWCPRREESCH